MQFASGVPLRRFPAGGSVLESTLNDQSATYTQSVRATASAAIAGVAAVGSGRIAVLGDSSCVDDAHLTGACFDFVIDLLSYASGELSSPPVSMTVLKKKLSAKWVRVVWIESGAGCVVVG